MAKKSLRRIIIFSVILLALFLPPFAKYQVLRWKSAALDNKIRALKTESDRLAAEKVKLQTDISYVEGRARDKIGVVKKGEIVLRETPSKK